MPIACPCNKCAYLENLPIDENHQLHDRLKPIGHPIDKCSFFQCSDCHSVWVKRKDASASFQSNYVKRLTKDVSFN